MVFTTPNCRYFVETEEVKLLYSERTDSAVSVRQLSMSDFRTLCVAVGAVNTFFISWTRHLQTSTSCVKVYHKGQNGFVSSFFLYFSRDSYLPIAALGICSPSVFVYFQRAGLGGLGHRVDFIKVLWERGSKHIAGICTHVKEITKRYGDVSGKVQARSSSCCIL